MSEGWNIAVLGATGAVGNAVLELLTERQFPVGELFLLATKNSAGESVRVDGKNHQVLLAEEFDWAQAHIAFFVAGIEASARYAEQAAESGCIVVDSSGLFAMAPDIPLVIADVNPQQLEDYRNRNIVSVADSQVSQLVSAIRPLISEAGLSRLQVTELFSVSSQGKAAVDALAGESARLLNGIPPESYYFGQQLAFNLMPLVVDQQGSVPAERRLVDQVRKILQDEGLPISISAIQAPVFYGNVQLVHVETLRPMDAEEARQILASDDSLSLSEVDTYPTPVSDASGHGALCLGAIANDYGSTDLIKFWSVADNIRFGGALMAVKVAERLVGEFL